MHSTLQFLGSLAINSPNVMLLRVNSCRENCSTDRQKLLMIVRIQMDTMKNRLSILQYIHIIILSSSFMRRVKGNDRWTLKTWKLGWRGWAIFTHLIQGHPWFTLTLYTIYIYIYIYIYKNLVILTRDCTIINNRATVMKSNMLLIPAHLWNTHTHLR